MLNIAMCDDNHILLQSVSSKIGRFLEKYNYNYNIDLFSSGEKLIEVCKGEKEIYQIAFLEVNIKETEDGLEIARRLRAIYKDKVIIIFLTAHDEYVFKCFEYSPFAFLRKRKIEEELIPILERVRVKLTQYKNDIQIFKTTCGEVKIDLTEVIYFERLARKTMIVTDKEVYETNYQLIQIEEMVDKRDFIMSHRSIIVNMKYIFSIEKDSIVLENKKKLPLSRHRIKDVRRAFNLYL